MINKEIKAKLKKTGQTVSMLVSWTPVTVDLHFTEQNGTDLL